ncbi:MAG: IS200/IS605 family transposase, partial [Tannerella sp.]|nr:IS200/IS605 family transposase [Tannerella sp.]
NSNSIGSLIIIILSCGIFKTFPCVILNCSAGQLILSDKLLYNCANYSFKQNIIMANTYAQINLQIVFSVKNRQSFGKEEYREDIEKYISGIVRNHNCKLHAIYCNPDHIHMLIGLRPNVMISELVKKIKTSSTKFIKSKMKKCAFGGWQDGYGVFSYSNSQISAVANYIWNQPKHHQNKTFKNEYMHMLRRSNIDFEDIYLFDFFE